MKREHQIKVRLSDDELAQLDEQRPEGLTRAAWLRELARRPPRMDELPNREQVIAALWQMSRDGKVQAAVALERALRNAVSDDDGDLLGRILNESD